MSKSRITAVLHQHARGVTAVLLIDPPYSTADMDGASNRARALSQTAYRVSLVQFSLSTTSIQCAVLGVNGEIVGQEVLGTMIDKAFPGNPTITWTDRAGLSTTQQQLHDYARGTWRPAR